MLRGQVSSVKQRRQIFGDYLVEAKEGLLIRNNVTKLRRVTEPYKLSPSSLQPLQSADLTLLIDELFVTRLWILQTSEQNNKQQEELQTTIQFFAAVKSNNTKNILSILTPLSVDHRKALLDRYVPFYVADPSFTPLIVAAKRGCLDMIKILVANGANVDMV
jgi:hypothetical protein